jgi:hypothetical protein
VLSFGNTERIGDASEELDGVGTDDDTMKRVGRAIIEADLLGMNFDIITPSPPIPTFAVSIRNTLLKSYYHQYLEQFSGIPHTQLHFSDTWNKPAFLPVSVHASLKRNNTLGALPLATSITCIGIFAENGVTCIEYIH